MSVRAGRIFKLFSIAVILSAFLFTGRSARADDNLDVQKWLARPGVRLLVVEFYATWCKPCMAAVPRWQELYEKYRDDGLRMVVVNTLDPDMGCTSPGWTPDGVLCDPDGVIQKGMGVGGNLPAAFLWNWQGDLLVKAGHVEQVEEAVQAYFAKNPRVLVEATDRKNRPLRELRDLVRAELRRAGKFTMVASKEERKELAALRKASFNPAYTDASQCELGAEIAANTLLRAKVYGNRLSLSLFSAETSCLIAQAATRYSDKRAEEATAEAVDKLLSQIRREVQTPGSLAARPPPPIKTVTKFEPPVVVAPKPEVKPVLSEPAPEPETNQSAEVEETPADDSDSGSSGIPEEAWPLRDITLGITVGGVADGADISWPIEGQESWTNSSTRIIMLQAEKSVTSTLSLGAVLMLGSFDMRPNENGVSADRDVDNTALDRSEFDSFGDDFEGNGLRVRTGALSNSAFDMGLMAVGGSVKARFDLGRFVVKPGVWVGYARMTRAAFVDPEFGELLPETTTEGIVYGVMVDGVMPLPVENLSGVLNLGIIAQPSGRSGDENVTIAPAGQLLLGVEYGL